MEATGRILRRARVPDQLGGAGPRVSVPPSLQCAAAGRLSIRCSRGVGATCFEYAESQVARSPARQTPRGLWYKGHLGYA